MHSLILGNFLDAIYLGTVNNTQRRRTGGAEDQARPGSATLLPLLSHVPVLILDGPLPSRVFPRGLTLLLIFSHSSCLDLMSSQISYSDLETRLHSLCSCRPAFTEAQGSADTGLAFPAAHQLSGGAAGCGLFPRRAPLPGEPRLMGCLESSIPSRKHSSTENRQHSTTNMASLLPRRHTDDLAVYISFISYSNVGEGHTDFHVASSSLENKWEITDSNKNGNCNNSSKRSSLL